MGITIRSKNFNADMGYGGFGNFRSKVATLAGETFGKHYQEVNKGVPLSDEEQDIFYKEYNVRTNELIEEKEITLEIADFCYQADFEGAIDQEQALQIYEKIKDYDDNFCYGYAGRSDCTMFSDLKNIFKDCAENGKEIRWR